MTTYTFTNIQTVGNEYRALAEQSVNLSVLQGTDKTFLQDLQTNIDAQHTLTSAEDKYVVFVPIQDDVNGKTDIGFLEVAITPKPGLTGTPDFNLCLHLNMVAYSDAGDLNLRATDQGNIGIQRNQYFDFDSANTPLDDAIQAAMAKAVFVQQTYGGTGTSAAAGGNGTGRSSSSAGSSAPLLGSFRNLFSNPIASMTPKKQSIAYGMLALTALAVTYAFAAPTFDFLGEGIGNLLEEGNLFDAVLGTKTADPSNFARGGYAAGTAASLLAVGFATKASVEKGVEASSQSKLKSQ